MIGALVKYTCLSWLCDVQVLSVIRSSKESVRDGPGAVVKGRREGLDRRTKGRMMDHGCIALGHFDKQLYMRG